MCVAERGLRWRQRNTGCSETPSLGLLVRIAAPFSPCRFEEALAGSPVDAVIDTVGGDYEGRSLQVRRRCGPRPTTTATPAAWE